MKGFTITLQRVLLLVALILVIGFMLGGSLWVFDGAKLLGLAVMLVIAGVW